MGCHVEMTRTPGRDYPLGSTYQPDEPPLQMTVGQLGAVREAAFEPPSDVHASSAYRRQLAEVVAGRATAQAAERAA